MCLKPVRTEYGHCGKVTIKHMKKIEMNSADLLYPVVIFFFFFFTKFSMAHLENFYALSANYKAL